MADPRTEPDVQVYERDNNGSTDPKANQGNPWYDRPKPVDSAEAAPARDPANKTGVPFAGEEMPSTPKAKPSGEQSLLNWIPGKKAPLN
jgi:hypothetical protein